MLSGKQIYKPLATQKKFHESPCRYRLLGGAAGGGKSRALRMEAVRQARSGENIKGAIFRKTFPELDGSIIYPLRQELPKGSYTYNKNSHEMMFGTSMVKFCHCRYTQDVFNYQGEEFDFIGFDELTHFTEFEFKYLLSRLRSTKEGVVPNVFATTNPGGIGHFFVKRLWIDKDYTPEEMLDDEHLQYDFIPSKVYDNTYLVENDPAYIRRLEALPEKDRKRLLDGDWNAFDGQFFSSWRNDLHVVEPFKIHATEKLICLDYGFSAPSAVYFLERAGEQIYCTREIYVKNMLYGDLLDEVERYCNPDELHNIPLVIDPALFAKDPSNNVSFAGLAKKRGWNVVAGINDRSSGWALMKEKLEPRDTGFGTKLPELRFFNTCPNAIRTIPMLLHDKIKVEDLNTKQEDHSADAVRYGLMKMSKTVASIVDLAKHNDSMMKRSKDNILKTQW